MSVLVTDVLSFTAMMAKKVSKSQNISFHALVHVEQEIRWKIYKKDHEKDIAQGRNKDENQ